MASSSSSSSSAHNPHHHLLFAHGHGTTAAPPPTPSSQPNLLPTSVAADTLSCLLHRLPTTLSLPSSRFARRQSSTNTTASATKADVPIVSLSDPHSNVLSAVAAASCDHGFFQLTHHRVTSQLAESAESDSASLFVLPLDQKRRLFPMNWPLGFDDEEEPAGGENPSFCLDYDSLSLSSKSPELSTARLSELTRELETLGIMVVEMIACALDFENPFSMDGPGKQSSLMWVSKSVDSDKTGANGNGRCYPYAVGLKYQIRCQEYRLEADTGPVLAKPEIGSILVTLGDVTQVWSNGKTKKVRGSPVPILNSHEDVNDSISMSLLVTIPLDSTISPLLPVATSNVDDHADNGKKREENEGADVSEAKKRVFEFNSIPFEDYAWRVYHERLFLKDTLDRYRIFAD